MCAIDLKVSTKNFQLYLTETKQLINSELSNLVSQISELRLHPYIEYALLAQGKRLRPILAILSAQSVGGDRDRIIPLALAFELLHSATLAHDDILDEDELRRGIPTLHRKSGVNTAILVGDAMISLGINLAADFGAEIMKIVSEYSLELCDGEYMDTSLLLNEITEENYFLKTRKKSASLFKAAAQCGALAGGGSRLDAMCLAKFGECFGMAYQIQDDLLDLTVQGSFFPKDLRTGQITLPLIHLYRVSNFGKREILEKDLQILADRNTVSDKNAVKAVKRILNSLDKAGSFTYCKRKITEYIQHGLTNISSLDDTEFKTFLTQMTKLLAPSMKSHIHEDQ